MKGSKFLTINTVKVRSVIIPFSSLNDHLCNFVRSVIVERSNPEFACFLGRTGSSTLARINGTNYICITKHELKLTGGLGEIRIAAGFGGVARNITFDQAIFADGPWAEHEEFADILLLRAHKQELLQNPDFPYFIPVRAFDRDKVFASFIVACPFYDDNIEVDPMTGETTGFHQKSVVRDCEWDKTYRGYARFVEKFTYTPKAEFTENGMSGGAVFSIVETPSGLEVFLHGIITMAGNGSLYVVSSAFLLNLKHGKFI